MAVILQARHEAASRAVAFGGAGIGTILQVSLSS